MRNNITLLAICITSAFIATDAYTRTPKDNIHFVPQDRR